MLRTLESKESVISLPRLTEWGLKVKFDRASAVINGKHSVEDTAKIITKMYVIDQWDDDSAYTVTMNQFQL